jgi:hypothetical protein
MDSIGSGTDEGAALAMVRNKKDPAKSIAIQGVSANLPYSKEIQDRTMKALQGGYTEQYSPGQAELEQKLEQKKQEEEEKKQQEAEEKKKQEEEERKKQQKDDQDLPDMSKLNLNG